MHPGTLASVASGLLRICCECPTRNARRVFPSRLWVTIAFISRLSVIQPLMPQYLVFLLPPDRQQAVLPTRTTTTVACIIVTLYYAVIHDTLYSLSMVGSCTSPVR